MTSKNHPDATSTPSSDMKKHIFGYAAGVSLFMIIIPAAIWGLSLLEECVSDKPLFAGLSLRVVLAAILFLWGMLFVVWSNLFLVVVGKGGPANIGNVVISPLTRKLVTSGPYRYTRNPMVFGANTVYLSIAIYLDSWLGLVALVVFFFTLVKTAVKMEEQRLLKDFGTEFEAYRSRTSMIIPFPPRKQS